MASGDAAACDASELHRVHRALRILTASIGITLHPGRGDDSGALLRRAAVANFHARQSSQGYAFYAGGLDSKCTCRLALMGELRRAIEGDELRLFCQPKVEIVSGRVCGVEALVRWEHPRHGMIDPANFISLAESAGLITPLTYWVLDASLRQSYAWHAAGLKVPLAVNLSPHDLRDPKLLERVADQLATLLAIGALITLRFRKQVPARR